MYSLIRAVIVLVIFSGCAGPPAQRKTFYNIDSLISFQVNNLKGKYELNKLVEIDGKKEETRFVPDSLQWAGELQIFRQIDQINKSTFKDAYVVSDTRDVNSNLTVREIKAKGDLDVPVSVVRFFYLRDLADLRKIEATLFEENTLYVNTRRLTIEFEPANSIHLVQRFRIEGLQKMMMNDSVRFVIAGEIGI